MIRRCAGPLTLLPRQPRASSPAANGAEALIQLLVAHGVQYLFLNPGTDTAPVQEAIVALGQPGAHRPPDRPLPLRERRAGGGARLLLHHAPAAGGAGPRRRRHPEPGRNLHNTQRAHAGVLIFAGRTPYTVDGIAPGSRDRAHPVAPGPAGPDRHRAQLRQMVARAWAGPTR